MKLTPINNPVALRLDTTVGTRIFAGNTMIHGDTGWRNVTDLYNTESTNKALTFESGGGIYLRRVVDNLYVQLRGIVSTTAADTTAFILPPGWRGATSNTRTVMQMGAAGTAVGHVRTTSGNALIFAGMPTGQLLVWSESSTAIIPATAAWPSTLIGLPA